MREERKINTENRKNKTPERERTHQNKERKNNRGEGEGDPGASEHPEKLLNTGSVSTFFLRSNPFLEQLTPPV